MENILLDVYYFTYIYIYFSSYNMWKHVRYSVLISRRHQGDNTVSVAQGGYCHSWRYQAAFATGQGI